MRKIIPALIVLGFFLLEACQKEVSFDDPTIDTPTDPAVTTNDSTLLEKLVYLDTNRTHPNDTVLAIIFRYDALKRVIKHNSYYYDNGSLRDLGVDDYFYNGNDTLPFKSTYIFPGVLPGIIDTNSFFTGYDGQARLIFDSVVHNNYLGPGSTQSVVEFYNFASPTKIESEARQYVNTSLNHTFRKVYRLQLAGQNITSQTDSVYDPVSANYVFNQFNATYDAKNNPVRKAFGNPIGLIKDVGMNLSQPNNYLTFRYKTYDPIGTVVEESQVMFAYEYDVNGNPKVARVTDVLGFFGLGNKIIYKYTR